MWCLLLTSMCDNTHESTMPLFGVQGSLPRRERDAGVDVDCVPVPLLPEIISILLASHSRLDKHANARCLHVVPDDMEATRALPTQHSAQL